MSATTVPSGTSREREPSLDRLLEMLRGQFQPLFALVDGARDVRVFNLLTESGEEYHSLYEGVEGAKLALFAPYLVRLPAQSPFLERLVRAGWGEGWFVFVTCDKPLVDLRAHFRRFLMVKTEDGNDLYFRFYDPRVLRVFLPTCTPAEANELFGPVGNLLMEGEQPDTLLQFSNRGRGAVKTELPLSQAGPSGGAVSRGPQASRR